jgi:tetratricopeptide (TPR) repeat protein
MRLGRSLACGESIVRVASRFDDKAYTAVSLCLSKESRRSQPFSGLLPKGKSKGRNLPSAIRAPPRPDPVDPRIQARPPGERDFEAKFPLPDVDKEKELGALQSHVAELYRSSQYRQAIKPSRDLLESTRSHFGTDHPATASAHNNLGLLHKHLGEYDESRRHYKDAMAIYKKVVGADHASYASALHNLGTCARAQLHLDPSLRATDRVSLLRESAAALEGAHSIRERELGREHPHTVASLSSWGATLAAQVLSHYKKSQDKWVSTIPTDASELGWQAAERHLRTALQTAVDNPRGPNLQEPSGGKKAPKPVARPSKAAPVLPSPSNTAPAISTLSGASAAQNLAVFLKARAVTESPPHQERLREAKDIYQQVLRVRSRLLPPGHADLYATKHSLAEVLEALGDANRANEIRQEILDSYEPDAGVQLNISTPDDGPPGSP